MYNTAENIILKSWRTMRIIKGEYNIEKYITIYIQTYKKKRRNQLANNVDLNKTTKQIHLNFQVK
jgi:hypothetical protein